MFPDPAKVDANPEGNNLSVFTSCGLASAKVNKLMIDWARIPIHSLKTLDIMDIFAKSGNWLMDTIATFTDTVVNMRIRSFTYFTSVYKAPMPVTVLGS